MSILKKIGLAFALCFVTAFVLLFILMFPPIGTQVSVPSISMAPNVMAGDTLYVSKLAYTVSDEKVPLRGDIILYRVNHHKMYLVKRVIGLPGDTVQMRAGRLYLNGDIIERKHRKKVQLFSHKRSRVSNLDLYEERITNDGPSYTIFEESDTSRADNTPSFKVPARHVFALGDNRDNSLDSRQTSSQGGSGLIPLENILGDVTRITIPSKACKNDKGYYCPKRKDFEKL